jgi:hypothetical protein
VKVKLVKSEFDEFGEFGEFGECEVNRSVMANE